MEEKNTMEVTQQTMETQHVQFPTDSGELTIDIVDIIRKIKPYLFRFCCIGLVCAIAVAVWGLTSMPVSYQATEKLYVTGGNNSLVDLSALQIGSALSSDYVEVFRNKEIHEQVRQALSLEYTDKDLDKMLQITYPTGRIIMLTVTSKNSEYEALRMVEEYSEAARTFIENRMEGRLPSIFEKATLLETNRGLTSKVIIAFAVGVIIPALIWLAFYLFDDRIKSRVHVEQDAGIPVFGVLTKK